MLPDARLNTTSGVLLTTSSPTQAVSLILWPLAAHPSRAGKAICANEFAGNEPSQARETRPGSDRNEMVVDLGYGLSPGLISLSPPHGQGTRGCHTSHMGRDTRRNTWSPHPSRQSFGTTRRIRPTETGSHLGSTLKPGGAVLTLGVFRRSRSVAYIRADASPSEVLAKAIVAPQAARVNLAAGESRQAARTGTRHG